MTVESDWPYLYSQYWIRATIPDKTSWDKLIMRHFVQTICDYMKKMHPFPPPHPSKKMNVGAPSR